ncbi:MAG: hypothetical protein Q8P86_02785 [bacterium]|nr:hypothetical protein [bacterium]
MKETLEWDVFEYTRKEKKSDWFWATGIISIAIAITSVMLGNTLFALVVLLGSFALIIVGHRKPRRIHVTLSPKGISVAKNFYPYSSIESFWVNDEGTEAKIIAKSKHILSPFIIVPIESVTSENVCDYLLQYLYEEEHKEPLSHTIMDMLGF